MQEPPEHDSLLIRGFLSGQAAALATVDSWVEVVLRRECWTMKADWDDLHQEVRLRVLRNLRDGRFRGDSELRTYVHRIAINAVVDFSRQAARRRERNGLEPRLEGRESMDARDPLGLVSRDLLRRILEGLSDDERRLLDMVHAQHLSYGEIARKLGVTEGAIKLRVFRCRERLVNRRRQLQGLRER